MKISYNWLLNYISPLPSPQETARILTDTGLEVESLEPFSSVPGGLQGIIIGHVIECTQHPNADRLKLTKVNVGNHEHLSIVCGAPNVAIGQKVVVAVPGTTLYPLDAEPFKIKESKIRGELSQGMICAEDEIGMGKSHDGIIILPEDAPIGAQLADYWKIKEDTVFEIGLTPNRIDAASHYGVARDLYAAFYNDNQVNLALPQFNQPNIPDLPCPVNVQIHTSEALKRYSGIVLENVKVGESPDWLKNALKSIGLRPINVVVDVTNYVLHELGQPLHAFDADKLQGNAIQVKTVAPGTKFTPLDGIERTLTERDLMICDAQKPVCLAGIMGGLDSGVSTLTKRIFLESANFDAVWVRKSSRHHQLKSDSSFRFERGADPQITVYALQRAAALIIELTGANIAGGLFDYYPNPVQATELLFSYPRMNKLIGEEVPMDIVISILEKLEINVQQKNTEELLLHIPPFKVDVKSEADVTEEVLRIYGYNTIKIPQKVSATVQPSFKPDPDLVKDQLSTMLVANGFYEVFNNSLTAGKFDRFTDASENTIKLKNPLSSELDSMRRSLIFGMCEAIAWNKNRQHNDLAFFEWGTAYSFSTENAKIIERPGLSIAVTGFNEAESHFKSRRDSSRDRIKGLVEMILERVGLHPLAVDIKSIKNEALEQSLAYINNEKTVCTIGFVKKDLANQFGLDKGFWYAEFDWKLILRAFAKHKPMFEELPRFPSVRRDLALVLEQNVSYRELEKIAYQTERKLLTDVRLFDVYEGDKLPKGKKSYAISFTFSDDNQTLTDKQVDKSIAALLNAFEQKIGASLRN